MSEPESAEESYRNPRKSFEGGFASAEQSAVAVAKTAAMLGAAAKQMQKAAQEGDISKLNRSVERLKTLADSARQDVANAKSAWPYSEIEQTEYLSEGYAAELQRVGGEGGLSIVESDGRLLAYPSVVQLLPNDLAIKVDRKKVLGLRPSFVVKLLLANQTKKSRYPAERFLEALYAAYGMLVPKDDHGSVVKLTEIYRAFTLQPGSSNEYGRGDFSRDLFMLDQSGTTRTRSGATVSFPASTATRGSGTSLFTFVAPTGEIATYFGIRFRELPR